MNNTIHAVQLTTVCIALMLLNACAKPPVKNAQLDLARASFESVSADSDVNRYSRDELDMARTSLASAEKAWRAKANTEQLFPVMGTLERLKESVQLAELKMPATMGGLMTYSDKREPCMSRFKSVIRSFYINEEIFFFPQKR